MADKPDVLDRAALDALREMTGDDPAFLAELLDAYFSDSRALLAAMARALDDGSAADLGRAAHSLKSNSANVGAQRLAALCRALEEQARVGALEDAAERLEQIEVAYEAAESALRATCPVE
jgi:HPt (histidine-containing phosphotransfer) domain-containing protein